MKKIFLDKLPYRKCVGACILNEENKVFVGQRADSGMEAWQMPQGGVENNESTIDAGYREVYEETGIKNLTLIKESDNWYYYDLPTELIPTLWGGKYRGQKQKWLLFRFVGTSNEINLYTKHQEFIKWRWIDFYQLPDLAIHFKRDVYQSVIKEFQSFLSI